MKSRKQTIVTVVILGMPYNFLIYIDLASIIFTMQLVQKFELTETTTQWRQQGMVLFPPPYQIAEESLQSLQNKMWSRQVLVFFISASRPTKMVMNICNPKDNK
jgi:hypothetical protein